MDFLRDKYNALYGQFSTLMPKVCKGVFLQQSKSMGDLLAKAMPIERILKAYSVPVGSLENYEKIYYQNAFKPLEPTKKYFGSFKIGYLYQHAETTKRSPIRPKNRLAI
ncbi:hypothetical protein BB434_08280 [Helicobacter pylori]|nr:hypothetical protein BB434_08280 [Helicobacter pylori]